MRFYPGLKPWDLDRLTFGEVEALVTYMNESIRAEERAVREAQRRG